MGNEKYHVDSGREKLQVELRGKRGDSLSPAMSPLYAHGIPAHTHINKEKKNKNSFPIGDIVGMHLCTFTREFPGAAASAAFDTPA